MAKHPTHIAGWNGSLETLACHVARMRYDAVAEFLKLFADDLQAQAVGDRAKGRVQLASKLEACAEEIQASKRTMEAIFHLCLPHMQDELLQENE